MECINNALRRKRIVGGKLTHSFKLLFTRYCKISHVKDCHKSDIVLFKHSWSKTLTCSTLIMHNFLFPSSKQEEITYMSLHYTLPRFNCNLKTWNCYDNIQQMDYCYTMWISVFVALAFIFPYQKYSKAYLQ